MLKDTFSIRASELDKARAMLESMAKDLAASVLARTMMKPGGQTQQQGAQQNQGVQQQQQPTAAAPQQNSQSTQPAPLSAANLEKNTQALNKMNQPKANSKANQAPPAPTVAQPPFQFGASSPHGNPSYIGKPKDLNLQLPPARKKQKLGGQQQGQTSQGATPSPQISKNGSPSIQRPQGPPKPVFLCTEYDCDMSTVGFATEHALQNHVEEEHTKPKEDPVKFVQENLALALGLEPDGSLKRDLKVMDAAPAMSVSNSKQGQTPGNLGNTPVSQDGIAMKRSASGLSKGHEAKFGVKLDVSSKPSDMKPVEMTLAPSVMDPWVNSTIDPQTLLHNLGFENGLPNIISDANIYRSLTPNDTPESSKDSGASEPNSDISEGAAIDIDVNWQTIDTDLLLDLNNTSLEAELSSLEAGGTTLDPSLLLDTTSGSAPDWDDIHIDFAKPFQLDTSYYSMAT